MIKLQHISVQGIMCNARYIPVNIHLSTSSCDQSLNICVGIDVRLHCDIVSLKHGAYCVVYEEKNFELPTNFQSQPCSDSEFRSV